MARKFFSDRDVNIFNKFNKELIDQVVGQTCIVYKISGEETTTNVYGESSGLGKIFENGVELPCLIDAEDFSWNQDEFGPDNQQNVTFSFLRKKLIDKNVIVEIGDIVEWNYAYFEIDTINENKLVGGRTGQNWEVVASAHLTRGSKLNIIERNR